MSLKFRDIYARLAVHDRETASIGYVHKRLTDPSEGFDLNLDPDYQRDHVWTDQQAGNFMGHMIEGGAIPDVLINRFPSTTGKPDEVVDGKQRLTAMRRWMDNEIPAILTDGRKVYFRDFDPESQRQLRGYGGPTFTIGYVHLDRADVLRLYIRLNRGGVVHTDTEIQRVRDLLAAEVSP